MASGRLRRRQAWLWALLLSAAAARPGAAVEAVEPVALALPAASLSGPAARLPDVSSAELPSALAPPPAAAAGALSPDKILNVESPVRTTQPIAGAAAEAPAARGPAAAPAAAAAARSAGNAPLEAAARSAAERFDGEHPFDAAPPPDLPALDTREAAARRPVRAPLSRLLPAPWSRALDARAQARHARRSRAQRLTSEEEGMREALSQIHRLVASGRPQEALDALSAHFEGRRARLWYREHPAYLPYWTAAMGYYRLIEAGLARDLRAGKARGRDSRLIAEAGALYRPTAIQKEGSGHCAFHALKSAIEAGAGFARPTSVEELVAFARKRLNRTLNVNLTAAQAARLGLDKSVDVDRGLTGDTTPALARLLGVGFQARPAPRSEGELLELLRGPARVVAVLRLFHPRHRLPEELASEAGHELAPVHHSVHLLGAFRRREDGGWLFLAQDSGSGTTDFYTWRELRHLAVGVELVAARRPVSLPRD